LFADQPSRHTAANSSRAGRSGSGERDGVVLIRFSSLVHDTSAKVSVMSNEQARHPADPSIDCRRSGRSGSRDRPAAGRRRGIPTALAVLGAVVVIAGCGASSGGGTGAPPSAAPSGQGSAVAGTPSPNAAAPDPNAPEIGAAGDIPDNQVYVSFTPPRATFTVSVPQGWAQSSAGTATLFTDKFNSVRIDMQPRPAAPDVASVRAQEVPQLQGSVPGFALGDVQSVQRSAGTGVLLTYGATSAPNAVTGKSVTEAVERYEFWRGGQDVMLTLSGPKGADNVDPWRKITDSLRWQQ
jgi:hypothetical protein